MTLNPWIPLMLNKVAGADANLPKLDVCPEQHGAV